MRSLRTLSLAVMVVGCGGSGGTSGTGTTSPTPPSTPETPSTMFEPFEAAAKGTRPWLADGGAHGVVEVRRGPAPAKPGEAYRMNADPLHVVHTCGPEAVTAVEAFATAMVDRVRAGEAVECQTVSDPEKAECWLVASPRGFGVALQYGKVGDDWQIVAIKTSEGTESRAVIERVLDRAEEALAEPCP